MTAGQLRHLISALPDKCEVLARVDGSIYTIDAQETTDYNADSLDGHEYFLYVEAS